MPKSFTYICVFIALHTVDAATLYKQSTKRNLRSQENVVRGEVSDASDSGDSLDEDQDTFSAFTGIAPEMSFLLGSRVSHRGGAEFKEEPGLPKDAEKKISEAENSEAAKKALDDPGAKAEEEALKGAEGSGKEVEKAVKGNRQDLSNDEMEEDAKTAAELTGVKMNKHGDMDRMFLTGLLNSGIVLAIVIVFSFLRLPYRMNFTGNCYLTGATLKDPAVGCNCFGWILASYRMDINEAWERGGLDAALTLEFCNLGISILFTIGVPMVCIMCPLHYFFGGGGIQVDKLSSIAMGNVMRHHPWMYYVHALVVVLVTRFVVSKIFSSMEAVDVGLLDRRYKWLKRLPAPRCRTVLVQNIPPEYRSDKDLLEFFQMVFPGKTHLGHVKVHAAKVVKDKPDLLAKFDEIEYNKSALTSELLSFDVEELMRRAEIAGATPEEMDYVTMAQRDGSECTLKEVEEMRDLHGDMFITVGKDAVDWIKNPPLEMGWDSDKGEEIVSYFREHHAANSMVNAFSPLSKQDFFIDNTDTEVTMEEAMYYTACIVFKKRIETKDSWIPEQLIRVIIDAIRKNSMGTEGLKAARSHAHAYIGDACSCCWKQEDIIDYYWKEIQILHPEFHEVRDKAVEEAKTKGGINMSAGFVTFSERREAEICKTLTISQNLSEWKISVPPPPNDVRYSDLKCPLESKRIYENIGRGLVVMLYIVYIPITCLGTNLEHVVHMGYFQPVWQAFAPGLALMLFLSFLPTVFLLIFRTFFILISDTFAQHKLQIWYTNFLIFFVILVTIIGRSLLQTISNIAREPQLLFELMATQMPKATHFYMDFLMIQWWDEAKALLRPFVTFKYIVFKHLFRFTPEESRHLSEPEDQDFDGMGSRSSHLVICLLIGVIFSTLSPLIAVLGSIFFVIARTVYGYLIVYAETRKPDLGGVFFHQQLSFLFFGLGIYNCLMVGVLLFRAKTKFPMLIATPCIFYTYHCYQKFSKNFVWESLPMDKVMGQDMKDKDNGLRYFQREFFVHDGSDVVAEKAMRLGNTRLENN